MIQKESIVKQLFQGQDYASQLELFLQKSVEDDDKFIHADHLLLKILNSFSEALSLLGSTAAVVSDSVATSQVIDSGCSEDSGDSRKRPPTATATSSTKPPGSYKRKKAANSVIKVAPTTVDGHAWRKYGQKDILNAKYPRCYFRCTHKFEKGCKATKQVQRKEDDPSLYIITYIGTHSCSSPFLTTLSPLQPPPAAAAAVNPNYYNWDPSNLAAAAAAPTIKEEECHHHERIHHSLWKDVLPFDDHHTPTVASPTCFDSVGFDSGFQYFDDQSGFNYL